MTYIALKLPRPDLDLFDVVANTTTHRLEGSRYRNPAMSDSGSK